MSKETQKKNKTKGELIRGFLGFMGSMEIFGNIAGLANSVQSGLQDFFYEPASGEDLAAVAGGFAKGTYSLLQRSVSGVTGSVASLTSALGTGLAHVSGDKKYIRERSMERHNKPKHIGEALVNGGKRFGKSLGSAVTGLWENPMRGHKESGGMGLIAGIGSGVVGLFAKPVIAVVDYSSDLVYGVGKTLPSLNPDVLFLFFCILFL